MTVSSTNDLISSDLNPLVMLTDPYPVYEELRELGPVVWMKSLGVWGVFRDEQVREVVSDHKRFGSRGGGGTSNYYFEKPWRERSVVFETDQPDHTRARTIFSRILSPLAVNKLREKIEAEAEQFVAKAVAMGTFDVIADLAYPFPLKVLPDAVGLPDEGRENMLIYNSYVRRGRQANWQDNWTEEEHREGERISAWVAERCKRESLSKTGFGAQFYAAADAGEISEHDAANMIRSFLAAGVETTMNGIANAINLLASNPDQWAALKKEPGKARAAFDEGLRIESTSQFIARNTLDSMVYYGTPMKQYDKIIAFVASANRDPKRWKDPNVYDINRNSVGHLTLGTGIHGCVGQMMARMEAGSMIAAFARAVDKLEVVDPASWKTTGTRQMLSMKIAVTPA